MRSSSILATLAMVVSLALLAGCASTSSQSATAKTAPTVDLEVFRDGAVPSKPCKVIAVIQEEGREEEQKKLETKLIEKAKGLGGHAIVFDVPRQSGFQSEFLGSFKVSYLYRATVVVYP